MKNDITTIQGFLQFVYQIYKSMKDNEVNLVYEGVITHQITKAFTSLAESNMEKDEEDNSVQRKVFHVMVECLQNISKHSDANSDNTGRGIFLVSRGSGEYSITTGNMIDISKKNTLEAMLSNINSMDKEALNNLYKEQIRGGSLSEKGGAGLGFIDIVRKTGQKLDYHFFPIDDKSVFFILTSRVLRKS